MRKILSCMVVILAVAVLSGCEWGSSSGGSTWSDAYSWVNFAGVYRPVAGKAYLVQTPGANPGTPGEVGETSQSIGVGGNFEANFSGTLAHIPVSKGSITVTAGGWSLTDPSGSGQLTGTAGHGTINYDTGAINVIWNLAPNPGVNVLVSYSYFVPGTIPNPDGPSSGKGGFIYSLTLSQTGNILDAVDNNGVVYHGEISSMSQSGGDKTGNTSGGVVANFTMTAAGGVKIVGILTGDYSAPDANGTVTSLNGSETANSTLTKAATETTTDTSDGAVTTGQLLNRQMQGTYIAGDGSTGDIQGKAGNITVTVTN